MTILTLYVSWCVLRPSGPARNCSPATSQKHAVEGLILAKDPVCSCSSRSHTCDDQAVENIQQTSGRRKRAEGGTQDSVSDGADCRSLRSHIARAWECKQTIFVGILSVTVAPTRSCASRVLPLFETHRYRSFPGTPGSLVPGPECFAALL